MPRGRPLLFGLAAPEAVLAVLAGIVFLPFGITEWFDKPERAVKMLANYDHGSPTGVHTMFYSSEPEALRARIRWPTRDRGGEPDGDR